MVLFYGKGFAADGFSQDTLAKKGFLSKVNDYFKDSNEDKTAHKKIDFSIIGGPHYSSEVKLGLGIVASGLYRIDKENMELKPSNISIYGDITTSGFFMVGVGNSNIFKDDKYRLNTGVFFSSMPGDFWGIGYDNAEHAEKSTFKRLRSLVTLEFMYRVLPNTYIGAEGEFSYTEGRKFTRIDYLAGQDKRYISTGAGLFISYDTRDYITAPSKGVHIKLDRRHYPDYLGNKRGFAKTEFTGNFYKSIWKGGILAYDLHGEFSTSSTPWTMIALMGGSSRMRGYYSGQYRDRNLVETQMELRQKIKGRHGMAAWVGAGNVFPDLDDFEWSHTLPTYGLGYRWEFKSMVNVRLDFGIGRGQTGFVFSINEAF